MTRLRGCANVIAIIVRRPDGRAKTGARSPTLDVDIVWAPVYTFFRRTSRTGKLRDNHPGALPGDRTGIKFRRYKKGEKHA